VTRLAALLLAARWSAAAPPASVAVVVDAVPAAASFRTAVAALPGNGRVTVVAMDAGVEADPIARGRLLARLARADLIVPVGERATGFVLAEREDVPVFFVGAASLVPGGALADPGVSGILPYNVAQSLAAVRALGLSPLALAYTPGYERIAGLVESGAQALGVAVIRRPIRARREMGPAVRDLMARARVVWVLGDPLLTREAGFAFLVEQSIAARVPVIAPGRFEVERGALLATEPAVDALAGQAVERLQAILAGGTAPDGARIREAGDGAHVLYNRALVARWNFTPGPGWRGVP